MCEGVWGVWGVCVCVCVWVCVCMCVCGWGGGGGDGGEYGGSLLCVCVCRERWDWSVQYCLEWCDILVYGRLQMRNSKNSALQLFDMELRYIFDMVELNSIHGAHQRECNRCAAAALISAVYRAPCLHVKVCRTCAVLSRENAVRLANIAARLAKRATILYSALATQIQRQTIKV